MIPGTTRVELESQSDGEKSMKNGCLCISHRRINQLKMEGQLCVVVCLVVQAILPLDINVGLLTPVARI